MDRRNFLKTAIALAACPTAILSQPKSLITWDVITHNLTDYVVISKGEFATSLNADVWLMLQRNNLMLVDDLTEVIVGQIEYSAAEWRRMIVDKHPAKKRISITPEEKNEIRAVINELREKLCFWDIMSIK